jgi:hypothetical protein
VVLVWFGKVDAKVVAGLMRARASKHSHACSMRSSILCAFTDFDFACHVTALSLAMAVVLQLQLVARLHVPSNGHVPPASPFFVVRVTVQPCSTNQSRPFMRHAGRNTRQRRKGDGKKEQRYMHCKFATHVT